MEIAFCRYQLIPLQRLNSRSEPRLELQVREGALLRIGSGRQFGYADLHPWLEYGDSPVDQQLRSFMTAPTFLALQTLELAKRDWAARNEGRSLYQGLVPLLNNFLISDGEWSGDKGRNLRRLGFKTIKLKAGTDEDKDRYVCREILASQDFKLRIDFNSTLNWEAFERFISHFSGAQLGRLEYVEDPFKYGADVWQEAGRLAPLALDFESEKISWNEFDPPRCRVLVIKPARLDMARVIPCLKAWRKAFAVTSSMDHPVGVYHSLSWSHELSRLFPQQALDSGCRTLQMFEVNSYSRGLLAESPVMPAAGKTGIGFETLLASESWEALP